jgi:hypothetical protein
MHFELWHHARFDGTARTPASAGPSAGMTPALYLDVQIFRPSLHKTTRIHFNVAVIPRLWKLLLDVDDEKIWD